MTEVNMINSKYHRMNQTTPDFFIDDFQKEIWEDSYQYKDETIEGTMQRLVDIIFEHETPELQQKLYDALINKRISFGGRVVANTGIDIKNVNSFNCYAAQRSVKPVDSIKCIYQDLENAAQILKTEGGIGFDFCIFFNDFIYVRRNGEIIESEMQYVRQNDEVLSADGLWHKVEETMSSFRENMMEIKLDSGRTVNCTDDHPLLVRRDGVEVWVLAKDLNENDDLVSLND